MKKKTYSKGACGKHVFFKIVLKSKARIKNLLAFLRTLFNNKILSIYLEWKEIVYLF